VSRALHKQELDALVAAGCDKAGCTDDHTQHGSVMYFHAGCHPVVGTWASYVRGSGELLVQCSICGREVMRVAVAEALVH
jgi:hypothetical protein